MMYEMRHIIDSGLPFPFLLYKATAPKKLNDFFLPVIAFSGLKELVFYSRAGRNLRVP
jgi:hypothetical protein